MILVLRMGFNARTSDKSDTCEHKPKFPVGKPFPEVHRYSHTYYSYHAVHHVKL